jgi:hypothetical protein
MQPENVCIQKICWPKLAEEEGIEGTDRKPKVKRHSKLIGQGMEVNKAMKTKS